MTTKNELPNPVIPAEGFSNEKLTRISTTIDRSLAKEARILDQERQKASSASDEVAYLERIAAAKANAKAKAHAIAVVLCASGDEAALPLLLELSNKHKFTHAESVMFTDLVLAEAKAIFASAVNPADIAGLTDRQKLQYLGYHFTSIVPGEVHWAYGDPGKIIHNDAPFATMENAVENAKQHYEANHPAAALAPAIYEVDDRGNVVQFYDPRNNSIVGEIDRESTVDGVDDQNTWIGNADVTAWAINNGYPEIEGMPLAVEFLAESMARYRAECDVIFRRNKP